MRCPFVNAVEAGDLDRARILADADGEPCEPAVFDQLVTWIRTGTAPRPAHAPSAESAISDLLFDT